MISVASESWDLLKSVSITFDTSDDRALKPSVASLTAWLTQFSQIFGDKSGASGTARHRLYDRELSLAGAGLLKWTKELAGLAEAAAVAGMRVSVVADLNDLGEYGREVSDLVGRRLVSSFTILATEDSSEPEPCLSLERLASSGVGLVVVGDMDWLARIGALESSVLNAMTVTWCPLPSEPSDTWGAGPAVPVLHCYARLRLSISPDGDVYPCPYLMGAAESPLGRIEGIDALQFLTDRQVHEALLEWATSGPAILRSVALESVGPGVPTACQIHIAAIGAGLAPTSIGSA